MKFVKITVAVLCAAILAACSQKMQIPLAGQKVDLKDTQVFLPQQAYDEQGKALAYEAKTNPYLEIKSKIDKGSVLLFIEAKKAIRKNDFATAKQKLGVITQKDTSISGPWVLLGNIAMEEKQLKKAQEYYQKAIKITPDNVNAYIALAKAQRLMGEFHVAQNTLALVLSIWKDCPEAHLNLGVLYDLYLNQPKKAQQHIEAYLFLDGYKNKQAIAWYNEIQSRTGIEKSFIDPKQGVNPSSLMSSVEG
ncbi:MAG: tetratricopeptide repeat protein [Gammaproteobacteria bacterium]|nr:tetratricopeptide repeat protein [Gammaproteobacteria bacterium]